MTAPHYTLPQRLVHWTVAGLVIVALAIGLTLGVLGFEGARDTFGLQATNGLFITHKTIGVLLLGLMAIRVVLRLTYGKPPYASPLAPWRRIASESVHGLLYLLLIVQPMVGWAATATGDFPINFFHWELPRLFAPDQALSETLFFWHGLIALAILLLVVLHVSAALHHWWVLRDGVMQRMSLFR